MEEQIYLDNAATVPLSADTRKYLHKILDYYANPSSKYSAGTKVRAIIENARKITADFINCKPENIYFTSGGCASNTLAIKGYCSQHECHVLYSPIAHKSILECAKSCPHCTPLLVNHEGILHMDYLRRMLEQVNHALVVIDYANSEIGTVQKAADIIDLVHSYQGTVYLDCTGSIPTIPFDSRKLDADMAGFSAHKLGGLKGCGVFYKKKHIRLEPIIYGSQEQGLFGGTENVLGIASLYSALRNYDYQHISSKNRDFVLSFVKENIPDHVIVGSMESRLCNNLYLCFRGIDGESLMLFLDMNGIQVSTGSACNSSSLTSSSTLSAIHMDKKDQSSCIRITFSGKETKKKLLEFCTVLKDCVEILRDMKDNL